MNYVVANIIVLIFEILYYSMFMYYSKQEGKFWKYVILFTLITIFFSFVGTNNLISYVILILMILYGLKYVIKLKVSLFDMLVIILMLFFKLLIEFIFCMIVFFITKDTIISIMIANVIKIGFIFIIKEKLRLLHNKLKKAWDSNNFYIRYLFSCFTYVYVILSIIFILFR